MYRVGWACLLSAVVILGALNCNSSEPGQEPAQEPANLRTDVREVTAPRCSTCLDIHLGGYTLFLREDYSGGHSVTGKVAAGGNITLDGFEVGSALPDDNVSNTLVAGGNLHLTNGNVFGATWYGGSSTPNPNWTVNFHRGTAAQGRPIEDFAHEFELLTELSSRLDAQPVNGTVRRETWNALTLTGTDPCLNVFSVSASDFTGTTQRNIFVPAGSFALVNIHGTGSTLSGGFNADLNPARVLYNFVDATRFEARGFGLPGTVLAPQARVTLNQGSWTGGVYAVSLSGDASGRLSPLDEVAGATAEVCNGTDDDCNGQVDEGFECSGSGSRSCTAWCGAEGTQTCDSATCGYGECTSASCCRADADCASGFYCEGSLCTAQRENGGACSSSNQCASGQCVDGVCCNTACAGECDACNLPGHEGTCSPVPSTVQCRGAAGECDVAESCTGNSAECPADAKKPATTECRGSAGVCDVAENCTGSSNDCPADGYASNTTQCRASAGECDMAESCTGTGVSCPADGFQSAGMACTSDSNVCTSDVCNGTGSCGHPPVPPETSCGTSYGAWGNCGGFSDYCDTTGTQSRTVTASTCGAGTCGPSSTTTETQACTRAAPDTTCAEPSYGEWSACSYSDTCAQAGTRSRTVTRSAYSCATGQCVASTSTETQSCTRNTEGVLCRAAGVCDLAERCSGGSCPADSKMPAGATCDDSNAGTTGDRCDGAGACTSCGDGVRNGPEACDDGNTVTETSCPNGQSSCTVCNASCTQVVTIQRSYCGDGVTNGSEVCDYGNNMECPYGQGCFQCNGTCTGYQYVSGPSCGDGERNGPEVCDYGNNTECPYGQGSCLQCNYSCTGYQYVPGGYCGDGVSNGPEACDDGNNVTETSCPNGQASCTVCNASCTATVVISAPPPPVGVCSSSDPAESLFISWYLGDLHRCADAAGLAWWVEQYNATNDRGCGPFTNVNDGARNDCFHAGFLAAARANGEYP